MDFLLEFSLALRKLPELNATLFQSEEISRRIQQDLLSGLLVYIRREERPFRLSCLFSVLHVLWQETRGETCTLQFHIELRDKVNTLVAVQDPEGGPVTPAHFRTGALQHVEEPTCFVEHD